MISFRSLRGPAAFAVSCATGLIAHAADHSNTNLSRGQVKANMAIVPVGPDGNIRPTTRMATPT